MVYFYSKNVDNDANSDLFKRGRAVNTLINFGKLNHDTLSRVYQPAALLLWGIVFVAVAFPVIIDGTFLRSTTGTYHEASRSWWANQGLYGGPTGMNYLPHFAILFSPFQMMPKPVGDLLWRWLSIGVLVIGWWRLVHLLRPSKTWPIFLGSSLLALGACGDAFRNGQANTIFAGLTLLAVGFLIQQRWWAASFALVGSLAIKPLGVVLLALIPFGYPQVLGPLTKVLVGFVVSPFLFGSPDYVVAQFREAWDNLLSCSLVTKHRFTDINGFFRTFGMEIVGVWSQLLRVGAGLATLGVWWVIARRTWDPFRGLFLLSLTTSFLMLFNPMNEVNSFVIFAPVAAIWAMNCWESENSRMTGIVMMLMVFSIGVFPELLRPLFNKFALWWDPLMTAIILSIVIKSGLQRQWGLGSYDTVDAPIDVLDKYSWDQHGKSRTSI